MNGCTYPLMNGETWWFELKVSQTAYLRLAVELLHRMMMIMIIMMIMMSGFAFGLTDFQTVRDVGCLFSFPVILVSRFVCLHAKSERFERFKRSSFVAKHVSSTTYSCLTKGLPQCYNVEQPESAAKVGFRVFVVSSANKTSTTKLERPDIASCAQCYSSSSFLFSFFADF